MMMGCAEGSCCVRNPDELNHSLSFCSARTVLPRIAGLRLYCDDWRMTWRFVDRSGPWYDRWSLFLEFVCLMSTLYRPR